MLDLIARNPGVFAALLPVVFVLGGLMWWRFGAAITSTANPQAPRTAPPATPTQAVATAAVTPPAAATEDDIVEELDQVITKARVVAQRSAALSDTIRGRLASAAATTTTSPQ